MLESMKSNGSKRETVLKYYDVATSFVSKLPGGLQRPILREMTPIREVYLETRPVRLMLMGASPEAFLAELAGADKKIEAGANDNGWREYRVEDIGRAQIFHAGDECSKDFVAAALARFQPDAVVVCGFGGDALRTVDFVATTEAAVIGWVAEEHVAATVAQLAEHPVLAKRGVRIFPLNDRAGFETAICDALPLCAQLEFSWVAGAKHLQAALAKRLLKSFSAVCGVIGLQPIPLADMPILVTLQMLMVSLIVHTTGRRADVRMIGEFFGALGINVGLGFGFRELARSLIKVIPFGNAVSGALAAAGTYAIGQAAITYFIDVQPLERVSATFREWRETRKAKIGDGK